MRNNTSRKIFISYKYGDRDVRSLNPNGLVVTSARHYVDKLETLLDNNDHIYKGEDDDESLEGFKDETIASKLRDKIFDSTITLVLISKNMKDPSLSESDQWIPWEISYSLKEMTRGNRTSGTNAILAIILPDRAGSYEYLVKKVCPAGCYNWQIDSTFEIIGKNMFNNKQPKTFICKYHPTSGAVHSEPYHSYIYPVLWDDFINNINRYINLIMHINENIDDYEITKIN